MSLNIGRVNNRHLAVAVGVAQQALLGLFAVTVRVYLYPLAVHVICAGIGFFAVESTGEIVYVEAIALFGGETDLCEICAAALKSAVAQSLEGAVVFPPFNAVL